MSFLQTQFKFYKFLLPTLLFGSFLLFPAFSQAGNPTKYVTVHDPYTRIQEGKTNDFMSTLQYYQGYDNYTSYFRVFVPPGATTIDLRIVDGGGNVAVARQNRYPDGTPDSNNTSVLWRDYYTLSELEKNDCYVRISNDEVLYVAYSGFNGLSLDHGGWLYVKVGGGRIVSYFQIQWHVMIYPEQVTTYNDWWDHYGSNADGSINWEKDVESVTEYTPFVPADFDHNGKVDPADYSYFHSKYKTTDSKADLDHNGMVNLADYGIFHKAYQEKKS